MKMTLLCILGALVFGCKQKKNNLEGSETSTKIEIAKKTTTQDVALEVFTFDQLEPLLEKQNDTIYVVNFWATWCAPCVKELPYFEELQANYKNQKLQVLLVSLDFPHLYEKNLKPFIIKNQLKSKVVALDDPDMNAWIPKVSSEWSGSIPATLIYKNDKKTFYEQSFTYKTLQNEVKPFLN